MIIKVNKKKDPRDENLVKYYGYIFQGDPLDIDMLATRISGTCTVTRHDCLAVLSALQEQVIYALQSGIPVRLGDIGSFRIMAQGAGADTFKDYDVSLIKKLMVRFTPNTALKEALSLQNKNVTLRRVNIVTEDKDGESDETGTGTTE